ncbi:dipeptide ABC transporter ATP-binding protein [Streptomyces sp. P6-2-1]|uniref:ABC transporter ATP-binding protein n=1 Tax=Streptomyces sp. P6-2-1 TaxID=3422591 RepID=UPI003D363CD6
MTTAATPLLHVADLGVAAARAHGEPLALLDSVALDVARGEAVAVVGESGSGKSLASRAVTGLLPEGVTVTGGTVALDGEDVLGLGPRARHALRGRRLTLLLQDPFTMLHPQLTCGRQIADGLRAHTGRGRAARAARRAEVARRLAEVGLDATLADRYPHELSGGMRQRVAIAAALAGDPDLLIADEPTTALDAASQRAVLDLLGRLGKDRGMGLVLITHDLRVAFEVCDRVYVFYAGTVLEHGRPADLRTRPRHPYTAALLAAEPSVRARREPLPALPGFVPAPGHRTPGCPFAPRCAHATDTCRAALVRLAPVPDAGEGRLSACVRIGELVREGDVTPVREGVAASVRDEPAPARPAAADAVLAVDAVARTFPGAGRPAVDKVSLAVAPGEVLALVGESGSGKTTLARIALGLESADAGGVRVGDVTLRPGAKPGAATRRALAAQAQIVFQDPYASLNPLCTLGATLAEALASPAARGGGPADKAARTAEVERLLAQVGLPAAYAKRRPAALSGGERQRVAIARALATRPRLLVCDEAVAALDVSVQAQLLNLLRALQRAEGFAILFITHDLGVVRQIADRVAVMYRGGLVEVGDTARVLGAPAHAWTRRMLAALPDEDAEPARKRARTEEAAD